MYLIHPTDAHWLPYHGVWQITLPTRGGRFIALVSDPHRQRFALAVAARRVAR